MLKRLYVFNYKSLVDFTLTLDERDELVLLLGPNGAGKSSVLDVLFALRQLLRGEAKIDDDDAFPTRTLTRWGPLISQAFAVDLDVGGETFTYHLNIEHDRTTQRAKVEHESLFVNSLPLFEFIDGTVQLYGEDHAKGPSFSLDPYESALARVAPEDNQRLWRFLDYMRNLIICRLHPAGFETESRAEDPLIERDGRNFSAWYRHMVLERPDLAGPLNEAVAETIDGFQALRLEKVGQDTRALMVVFQTGDGEYRLRFDELSDGQRALIALYAFLHLTQGQSYTLFLDEPANHLALPEIQPWLIALADACGASLHQAVLCSHHPELIDYLGPDRGIELTRANSGIIAPRRVEVSDESPNLKLSELIARGWLAESAD